MCPRHFWGHTQVCRPCNSWSLSRRPQSQTSDGMPTFVLRSLPYRVKGSATRELTADHSEPPNNAPHAAMTHEALAMTSTLWGYERKTSPLDRWSRE
mmetsp:Transcript_39572/g.104858  ORF Transcript_39572/g.104858 Transcript_39572/m.104858 type:complete len:97 (-) Transcript_39572:547-837(-)